MNLPGLRWWIKDDYGRFWHTVPFDSYVHAWYFRERLRRSFPEFTFSFKIGQRDPKRPMPFCFTDLGGRKFHGKEKEPIHRDPTAHSEEDF